MTERAGEAGFGLIELVVCVGLLATGCVCALLLVPSLARQSQAEVLRAAALDVARNAVERTRAAVAYYPPVAMSDPAQRAIVTANHVWALRSAASYSAAVRVRRALCGAAAQTTDVPMRVTMAYDADGDTLTVTVSYPADACDTAKQATVSLSALLAPAAYVPQTQLPASIADPALQ